MERVQAYLRRLLGSERIRVIPPVRPGLPVELAVGEEVVGTIYEDRDEGELSYAVQLTILGEDLPPPAKPAPAASPSRTRRGG